MVSRIRIPRKAKTLAVKKLVQNNVLVLSARNYSFVHVAKSSLIICIGENGPFINAKIKGKWRVSCTYHDSTSYNKTLNGYIVSSHANSIDVYISNGVYITLDNIHLSFAKELLREMNGRIRPNQIIIVEYNIDRYNEMVNNNTEGFNIILAPIADFMRNFSTIFPKCSIGGVYLDMMGTFAGTSVDQETGRDLKSIMKFMTPHLARRASVFITLTHHRGPGYWNRDLNDPNNHIAGVKKIFKSHHVECIYPLSERPEYYKSEKQTQTMYLWGFEVCKF